MIFQFSLVFSLCASILFAQVNDGLLSGRYSSNQRAVSSEPIKITNKADSSTEKNLDKESDEMTVRLRAKKISKGKKSSKVSKSTVPMPDNKAPTELPLAETLNPPKEDVLAPQEPNTPPKIQEKVMTENISLSPGPVKSADAATPTATPPTPIIPELEVKETKAKEDAFVLSPYVENVHPDDVRNNKTELDLLPAYFWHKSASRYSYRDYKSDSMGISFSLRSIIDENYVGEASYLGSFAADIEANDATKDNVATKYEMIELGLKRRNYFGLSRKAIAFSYGLAFIDKSSKVSGGEGTRASVKTSGLKLAMDLRVPMTPHYAQTLGAYFVPKATHSEKTTALALDSGRAKENYVIGLKLGGEFKINRHHQLLWSLEQQIEKNQFSGEASLDDPDNGLKPENVSVTQTMSILSFGYRWGE